MRNQSRLDTQMHTAHSNSLFLSLSLTQPHRHTPEEQYLNLLLFVLETEQRYSSDRSKMCFLAGISNSNDSNELEEKTGDWKRLGISKFKEKKRIKRQEKETPARVPQKCSFGSSTFLRVQEPAPVLSTDCNVTFEYCPCICCHTKHAVDCGI